MDQNKYWACCVRCFTYNQSPYIEEAMNGFTMQQTSFPYVCCIVDDASADGEQKIIKHYLEEHLNLKDKSVVRNEETEDFVLTFAQHKTNRNCYFAVLFLKYNHYLKKSKMSYIAEWHDKAKYIAMCEGDDYWTDPLKLQKQFDFMEAHTECSLCFHSNYDLYPSNEKIIRKPEKIKEFYTPEDAIYGGGGFMATNSMFYRGNLVNYNDLPYFWKCSPVGDLPLMLYLVSKGTIGYIDETMSVYRRQAVGSWSTRQNSIKVKVNHHKAIVKMFHEYDKYMDYQYHSVILKAVSINRKIFIKKIFKMFAKRIFKHCM